MALRLHPLAGRSRWLQLLMIAQGLSLGAYAVLLVAPVPPGWGPWRDLLIGNLTRVLPGVVCLARALTRRAGGAGQTGDDVSAVRHGMAVRRGYFLLGVGCLFNAGGNLLYALWIADLSPVPFPSWADVGFLGSYVLFAAGVLVLARAELGLRLPGAIWWDGLTGVLGTAAVGSVLGLPVILAQLSGSAAAALVTGAAYPILDLLLASMVVGAVALRGGRPGLLWGWVGTGLLVFAVSDTIYMWRVTEGAYTAGTVLDLGWALGTNLIAVVAWCRPPAGLPDQTSSGRAAIALPIVASICALAVLTAGRWVQIPAYSVALAGAALLAALGRTAIAFRSAHLLIESRAEARTDDLTGVDNRRAFYEQAEQAVQRAGDAGVMSMLLLDLDRFKEINDSLGHDVGDQLLKAVAERLRNQTRAVDYLARLGGDEFVIVMPDTQSDRAEAIAARLLRSLAEPYHLHGLDLQITASLGIAAYPEHASDVSGLLQRADVAMYQAKVTRAGFATYDPARDEPVRDRLGTVEQLRQALADDQLVLHYQPQCDVQTGAVRGVEALVRWQHPSRGLLQPDQFLPLVEQTGLMPALARYVLDRAVGQCGQWRRDGLNLTVAVNLSVSNLLDDRLPEQVARLLVQHAVPAELLLLEVTENTLMVDPERATATMSALHALGIGLSVDDYGTGYCSLAYLRDLPVDELKLDRSFLRAATPGSRASAIVRSTIDLAHALGLRMVAEGVEDAAALQLLRDNNCDVAQGYHLGRPLPAAEVTRWIRTQPLSPRRPDPGSLTVAQILAT